MYEKRGGGTGWDMLGYEMKSEIILPQTKLNGNRHVNKYFGTLSLTYLMTPPRQGPTLNSPTVHKFQSIC